MGGYGETALVRGLSFLAEKQAAIANNLANVDTTSFKRRASIADGEQKFHSMLDRELEAITYTEQSDMQRGTIRETGNKFDIAIDGTAWMRVQDDKGKQFYTRNGQLQIDTQGRLTTRSGLKVLDQGGQQILLGAGDELPEEVTFSQNGTISNPRTGQTWGPIALVNLPDASALVPIGQSLYIDPKNQ
ncbi:MAG: flagellar hook basal-body protein, partial [Planctomycetes bacterium]|nr:flagellar hook basal-body protein [Planctomycetota bacterium]